MKLEDFAYTILGVSYDILELQSMYQEVKHYRRPTGLYLAGGSTNKTKETDPDKTLQSQIKPDNVHVLDTDKQGYDVTSHPAVKKIIDQFNIKIKPGLVDINCFRPNFEFLPHTDQVKCTIMIPIIPEDGGAPINFYSREGVIPQAATDYRRTLSDADIVFKHSYSTIHPTIINQQQIHGVSKLDHERVYLRFKINDFSYEELVELDKQGKLIKL
jgi:hypothetical protein